MERVGTALLLLSPLAYLLDVEDSLPLLGPSGEHVGQVSVKASVKKVGDKRPKKSQRDELAPIDADLDEEQDLFKEAQTGDTMQIELSIQQVGSLHPEIDTNSLEIRLRIPHQPGEKDTHEEKGDSNDKGDWVEKKAFPDSREQEDQVSRTFTHTEYLTLKVNKDIVKWLKSESISLDLWARRRLERDNKEPGEATDGIIEERDKLKKQLQELQEKQHKSKTCTIS